MINKQEVEHIANLARLALTEEEKVKYSEQLSSILGYVDQLQEVDTSQVDYEYQVEGLENVTSADEALPVDGSTRQTLIDAMPEKVGDLLKVKGVFE